VIFEALFEASSKIPEYLENPEFKHIYAGELRNRLEKLVTDMEAVRNLPGTDVPLEASELEARTKALDQWHMQ
jgi:hypothetical protein